MATICLHALLDMSQHRDTCNQKTLDFVNNNWFLTGYLMADPTELTYIAGRKGRRGVRKREKRGRKGKGRKGGREETHSEWAQNR